MSELLLEILWKRANMTVVIVNENEIQIKDNHDTVITVTRRMATFHKEPKYIGRELMSMIDQTMKFIDFENEDRK